MSPTQFTVKWGKQDLAINFDLNLGLVALKQHLQTITSVPAEKQKFLVPGGLKDDDNLSIKAGSKITMLGTAEGLELKTPLEQTMFVEDMTPEETSRALKMAKKDPLPVGLENLGNTCYMNSVVQCLVGLPRLQSGLQMPSNLTAPAPDKALAEKLRDLMKDLRVHAAGSPVTPYAFLAALRQRFPQFNQRDSQGHFIQQDAEECFRGILESLAKSLVTQHPADNLVDELFGFDVRSKLSCTEAKGEQTESVERQRILLCHLGSQTEPVNHLHEGVKLSLREEVEKDSHSLGRIAKWEKVSAMAALPEYLVVQFARFQWKAKSDSAGTEATRTKIVRKCTFGKNLDVYDFCTDEVKASLVAGRSKKVELQDFEDLVPAEGAIMLPTGAYTLAAIVSHQGRSAEGGHYVGWVKWKKGARVPKKGSADDIWLKFDDETVTEHDLKAMVETGGICGGLADTQMAYFCIYEKETLPSNIIEERK